MLIILAACGKKPGSVQVVRITEPAMTYGEFDRYTEKQSLVCLTGNCPESIARVMIYHENEEKIDNCTGFLIGNDMLVTAASCLPTEIVDQNKSCTNRIRFSFAATEFEPSRTAECVDVISVGQKLNSTLDQSLNLNGMALLRLDQKIYRKIFIPSETHMNVNSKNKLWSVLLYAGDQAIIRSQNCQMVFDSYAHPLKKSNKVPTLLMSGCQLADEERGSPIVDDLGRVYATAFSPLAKSTHDYFRDRGLLDTGRINPLLFATNTTCYLHSFYMPSDLTLRSECVVDWSQKKLDDWRSNIIENSDIHAKLFQQMQDENTNNSERNQYLRWRLEFNHINRNSYNAVYTPVCFDNVSQWMPTIRIRNKYKTEVKTLRYDIILRFDPDLKSISKFRSDPVPENLEIEFSSKLIKKNKKSYLKVMKPSGATSQYGEMLVCQ